MVKSEPHLRAIGIWTDRAPVEFVDEAWRTDRRPRLVAYLRSGFPFGQRIEQSWCRFRCGDAGRDLGASDLTDGTWVWPRGLAHYVARHTIRLPEAFAEHVERSGYRIGAAHPPSAASELDHAWWGDWCRKHGYANPFPSVLAEERVESDARHRRETREYDLKQSGNYPSPELRHIVCRVPLHGLPTHAGCRVGNGTGHEDPEFLLAANGDPEFVELYWQGKGLRPAVLVGGFRIDPIALARSGLAAVEGSGEVRLRFVREPDGFVYLGAEPGRILIGRAWPDAIRSPAVRSVAQPSAGYGPLRFRPRPRRTDWRSD